MRDRVGQVALALHQLGHARGHAVGMVNDDPDLRAWRHLRPCLQVAGPDAVGMQAQRFQVAPQQADPGIQAGPDQQQDAVVGGDGHVGGHQHLAGQAQVQPAAACIFDGQQDLLVMIADDEAVVSAMP
ncbi:hypothetical protein G6F66_013767 [Rhizopus arrhizus]|nr:hypothetical protein G6F66_013767 [Rhizopus arrhizus]